MKYIKKLLKLILISTTLFVILSAIYFEHYLHIYQHYRINKMYDKLWAQTGQSDEKLPLFIVDKEIENAYNDGKKIVIYQQLIDNASNFDEIALILGHEIAHGTLRHVYYKEFGTDIAEVVTAEANADKLGAVYMMKAGYDVCRGREIYKRWTENTGNFINRDHPTFSYRYDELNINCD